MCHTGVPLLRVRRRRSPIPSFCCLGRLRSGGAGRAAILLCQEGSMSCEDEDRLNPATKEMRPQKLPFYSQQKSTVIRHGSGCTDFVQVGTALEEESLCIQAVHEVIKAHVEPEVDVCNHFAQFLQNRG